MEVNESVSEYFARLSIVLMKLERHNIITPAREIKRIILNSLTPSFPTETCVYAMRGDFELKDLENGLAHVEKFQSGQKRRSAPSHALAVAHAAGGQTGIGGEPVGEAGKPGPQAGATTMVMAAISSKDVRGRCAPGSSTSHSRRLHNSRTHSSSISSSSSVSHDSRSHNSRDRSISSPTPGAAGREHLTTTSPTSGAAGEDHHPNSGEENHITSGDHNIGEEISHTSSAQCVSSAVRRSISPQTA